MPNDSIFEEDELQAEQVDAGQEPLEEDDTPTGPERDEQGRFKAKEPEEEADPNVNDETDAGKTVPQGALHAEREKRKAVQAELEAAKQQLAAIARMREQTNARKPEPLPEADDPAAMEHLRARLAETEQRTVRMEQQRELDAADYAETQQLYGVMASAEAAFRAQQTDYDDAISYLAQARAKELTRYGMSPPQINQVLSEEAAEIARTAIQQGMNPAELAYGIAQDRGYRPTQAEAAPPAKQGGAAATLEAIAKAQGASKSLGAGGGSSGAVLTAEAIAAMDADEFEKLYATPEGKALIDAL